MTHQSSKKKVYPEKVDLRKVQLGKLLKLKKDMTLKELYRQSLIKKIKKMRKYILDPMIMIEGEKLMRDEENRENYNLALTDVLKMVEG